MEICYELLVLSDDIIIVKLDGGYFDHELDTYQRLQV